MNESFHPPVNPFRPLVRKMAGAACALLVAGCGHKDSAQASVVSCQAPAADHPVCVEFEPYNDDMRLVAISQCRDGGGAVGSACPTENIVGSCERVSTASFKDRKPWEFSRRNRSVFYDAPGSAAGPADPEALKKQCEATSGGRVAGQWTTGRPAP